MLDLQSGKNEQAAINVDTGSQDSIEVNLRESCLTFKFMSSCFVTDESGSPDRDFLIGMYRFTALKERV